MSIAFAPLLLLAAAASPAPGPAGAADPAQVKRGEYLVRLGGCNDCHTPWKVDRALGVPAPDLTRRLSGHPADGPDPAGKYTPPDSAVIGPDFTSFALPFGTVYSSNLTPDPTGLGDWTEPQFAAAMRTGRHTGDPRARPILPPMPWMSLAHLTDADLAAIWAYLRSLPPIRNAVPPPKVPESALAKLEAALTSPRPP
ncbi:c-type cytochrome [Anaeromyxobacter diazotrophicus]|uniref:Cytochrome c n=1 Tax=Anaeromyxobacter diazotrophicus TaxID=2590199 RepID=A0A7I9VH72_9BACT|nr:c-type cytochrome [Anaeromyxobacter diazotrophicus]GEJ55743.1 cytochrome c [Anaeromyxobacter diazotrophicus]